MHQFQTSCLLVKFRATAFARHCFRIVFIFLSSYTYSLISPLSSYFSTCISPNITILAAYIQNPHFFLLIFSPNSSPFLLLVFSSTMVSSSHSTEVLSKSDNLLPCSLSLGVSSSSIPESFPVCFSQDEEASSSVSGNSERDIRLSGTSDRDIRLSGTSDLVVRLSGRDLWISGEETSGTETRR